MSKKPSLHDAKLRGIKAELSDEERDEKKKMFRTSVILRESQKLALEEERLRLRREEGSEVVPMTGNLCLELTGTSRTEKK